MDKIWINLMKWMFLEQKETVINKIKKELQLKIGEKKFLKKMNQMQIRRLLLKVKDKLCYMLDQLEVMFKQKQLRKQEFLQISIIKAMLGKILGELYQMGKEIVKNLENNGKKNKMLVLMEKEDQQDLEE